MEQTRASAVSLLEPCDPNEPIGPGDVFQNVPFLYPVNGAKYLMQEDPIGDPNLWRAHMDGDLPGFPYSVKFALNEVRRIFAVVHFGTPPCEIGKYVESTAEGFSVPGLRSEQHIITMFECQTKNQLGKLWYAKAEHPDRYKRLFPVGALPGKVDNKTVDLTFSFRRYQQFLAWDIAPLKRVARLTEDGMKAFIAAHERYLLEGEVDS